MVDLITALKNGNEWAFEEVFLSYKEKVLGYFFKKTGTLADSEDLLQNTFLRLWKYRSSLDQEFLLDQHLFNIARTVFIDYTRTQNKLKKLNKLDAPFLYANDNNDTTLDKEKLEAILNKMPELRKKVFLMHKMEGYSYKEIAEILSIDTKKVDNHISRALKHIKKNLLSFFCFYFF